MPVTAKLSRQFYEKLGDDVTNELVEWLNAVDTASRDQIRELNESNSRRIDARFDGLETKVEARFAAFEAKFAAFEARTDGKFAAFEARTDGKFDAFRVELHAFKAELVKWMFLFWIGTMFSMAGLLYMMGGRTS